MVVISVPVRLRLASAALFLCIPCIAFEVVLVSRVPWWNLPYHSMAQWALVAALICVPLTSWMLSAKKWALSVTYAFAGVWIGASTWLSIHLAHPALGFFTLFLVAFFFLELNWLKQEMQRSFFDPQLTWYQGLPKPIPGLKCQITLGEKLANLKVSRIDRDGAFIFSQAEEGKYSTVLPFILERKQFDAVFNFRDRQISCSCAPTLSIHRGAGAGIQFLNVSPDLKKDIGDFIEILRGEGYV